MCVRPFLFWEHVTTCTTTVSFNAAYFEFSQERVLSRLHKLSRYRRRFRLMGFQFVRIPSSWNKMHLAVSRTHSLTDVFIRSPLVLVPDCEVQALLGKITGGGGEDELLVKVRIDRVPLDGCLATGSLGHGVEHAGWSVNQISKDYCISLY